MEMVSRLFLMARNSNMYRRFEEFPSVQVNFRRDYLKNGASGANSEATPPQNGHLE